MSHFEYISVAMALIYAIAVGRLLSGVAPAIAQSRRYWVHLAWILVLLLVSIMAWWLMWAAHDVVWTPIRFLWVLFLPALIYVRAAVLLGSADEPPDSYREHFYAVKSVFFSLGIVAATFIGLSPWVLGTVPWFTPAPLHANAALLFTISGLGIISSSPKVQAALAILSLLSSGYAFFAIPLSAAGA